HGIFRRTTRRRPRLRLGRDPQPRATGARATTDRGERARAVPSRLRAAVQLRAHAGALGICAHTPRRARRRAGREQPRRIGRALPRGRGADHRSDGRADRSGRAEARLLSGPLRLPDRARASQTGGGPMSEERDRYELATEERRARVVRRRRTMLVIVSVVALLALLVV